MVKLHNMLVCNIKLAKICVYFLFLFFEILTFSKKFPLFFRPLHAASLSLSCLEPRLKGTFMVEFLSVQNCNILKNSKFKLAFFGQKIFFFKNF